MKKNIEVGSGEAKIPDATATVRLATFDQHRSLLFSVAYRMLCTVAVNPSIGTGRRDK